MNILYCIPDLNYGGSERQLSYLATELVRSGHEIHVAANDGGPLLEQLLEVGVTFHRVGRHGRRRLPATVWDQIATATELIRLIGGLRPQIVQTCGGPMDVAGGAAAMITRTPWIIREASWPPAYRSLKYKLRRYIARSADHVIANSRGAAAYWQSRLKKDQVSFVQNPRPPVDMRTTRGSIIADASTVLYVGRIDEGKNVETLIRAIALNAKDVSVRAVICGDGPRREACEHLARALGLEERVLFIGSSANSLRLMQNAGVVVTLSRFEGCPNVVLEAISTGCPVIASDIPAHRELLTEEHCLFVDPDDDISTAKAIRNVLSNPVPARTRARAAVDLVNGRSIDVAAAEHVAIYSSILGTTELNDVAAETKFREAA